MHSILPSLHSANLRANFNPENSSIQEIKKWLKAESIQSNSGFYTKWDELEEYYKSTRILVLEYDNHPIGFICWQKNFGPLISIEYLEIRPDCRRQGYGRKLVGHLLDHLSKVDYSDIVFLEYISIESRLFWTAIGFEPLPDSKDWGSYIGSSGKILYKVLKPFLPPVTIANECIGD